MRRRARLALQAGVGAGAVAWEALQARMARRSPPSAATVMMHRLDSFVTWHDRPKAVVGHPTEPMVGSLPPTAIVIQGQVIEESDFTAESVRMYRSYYPGMPVFVSTWNGTSSSMRRSLEQAGATVVLSEIPANAGNHNMNMQVVSSAAGMAAAKEGGAEFALKTRTDQRLYAQNAVPMMHALLEAFPVGSSSGSQVARIVSSNHYTYKYFMYAPTDHVNFGTIQDMVAYWTPVQDPRSAGEIDRLPAETPREIAVRRVHEGYFCSQFLEETGWELQWTLADWWRALAERFVVIDTAMLDLLWPKYTMREYLFRGYGPPAPFDVFAFADWLPLTRDPSLESIHVPEDLLDRRLPWTLPTDPVVESGDRPPVLPNGLA